MTKTIVVLHMLPCHLQLPIRAILWVRLQETTTTKALQRFHIFVFHKRTLLSLSIPQSTFCSEGLQMIWETWRFVYLQHIQPRFSLTLCGDFLPMRRPIDIRRVWCRMWLKYLNSYLDVCKDFDMSDLDSIPKLWDQLQMSAILESQSYLCLTFEQNNDKIASAKVVV